MKIGTARAYSFAQPPGAYVLVLDTANVPCSDIVKGGFEVKARDVVIHVGFGPEASAQQFVQLFNETAHVATGLLTVPQSPGQAIDVCVPVRVRLTSEIPSHATVEVEGRIHGTYCGVVR